MSKFELAGKYELNNSEIELYDENGFLFLESVLSPKEVNHYKIIIDEIVDKKTSHDKRPLEARTPYEREFLQCSHIWNEFSQVKNLTLSTRLASIAKQLHKANHIRLWHDQALYKLPGGSKTEPHQDLSYWPMLDRNAGTIWIALEEVTLDMGAMYFIPGSHKSGIDSYENRIEDAIEGRNNLVDHAKIFN